MKSLLAVFVLAIIIPVCSLSAQTVNDTPIKEIDTSYIELSCVPVGFTNRVSITVDFGQRTSGIGIRNQVIKNGRGEKVEFNSIIEALNFFDKLGYEFLQAYTVSSGSTDTVYYLMRKRSDE